MRYIKIVKYYMPTEEGIKNQKAITKEVEWKRQRLSTLVKRHPVQSENVRVFVNSVEINENKWKYYRVRENDVIDIMPKVGFWGALNLAAMAVQGAMLSKTMGMNNTWGNILWGPLCWYLGGLLIDDPPTEYPDNASDNYAWNALTTQNEGVPIAKFFGKQKLTGNVISSWTDVDRSVTDDGDEILYALICFGEGPVEGLVTEDLLINGQPYTNFTDIDIETTNGTLGQSALTEFQKNKLEYRFEGQEVSHDDGPITITTPNEFFDDIEVTISFPRGLIYYRQSGTRYPLACGYKIEASVKDADSWSTVFEGIAVGTTTKPIYRNHKFSEEGFSVSYGTQYDIRVSKLYPDSSSDRITNDMELRSMREVVNVAFTRPGRVLMGAKVKGDELLGSQFNVSAVWEGAICNVYDGASWNLEYTRNRAWIVFFILTQPIIDGDGSTGNPYTILSYEGMDPSYIDTAFFYEWAQWCDELVDDGSGSGGTTEARMTCDFVADYDSDVWSYVNDIAKIGRCYLYWQGTTLTGWLDTTTATVSGLVAYQNVKDWKNTWISSQELAGRISVYYRDNQQDYERTYISVFDEDAGTFKRRVDVEGTGVVSTSLAQRVGKRILQRNKLVRNRNEFKMGKEGLFYELGEVIRVQHRTPNWGKGFRVKKTIDDHTIQVDHHAECAVGDALYVQVFNDSSEDIEVDSYVIDKVIGDKIEITTTWDVYPKKDWIVTTGSVVLRRIIKKTLRPDHDIVLLVETYDGTIEDTDDETPVVTRPNYNLLTTGTNRILPPVTMEQVYREMTSRQLPDVLINFDIPYPSNITWTGNGTDTVYWEPTDNTVEMEVCWKGTVYEIYGSDSATGGDSTTDKFILFNPELSSMDGFVTTNSDALAYAAMASGSWLMCINDNGTPRYAIPMPLIHAGVLMARTITAELGQIAHAAIGTLEIQGHAVTLPTSEFTASAQTLSVANVEFVLAEVCHEATGEYVMLLASGTRYNSGNLPVCNYKLYRDLPVGLLCHMDGSDAATDCEDDSVFDHQPTFIGTAQLDTAYYAFGTSSLLLDGNSDGITFPDHAVWNLADNDFTIDCWVRFNSLPSDGYSSFLVSRWANTLRGFACHIGNTGGTYYMRFSHSTDGTSTADGSIGSVSIATNTWYHFAWVRNGNTLYGYIDGTQVGTLDFTGVTIYDPTATLDIGFHGGPVANYYLDGWIDEIRILTRYPYWTTEFDVFTEAYQNPAILFESLDLKGTGAYRYADAFVSEDEPNAQDTYFTLTGQTSSASYTGTTISNRALTALETKR